MGTPWTNKYAILRDLSYAQGRMVPADISKGSVGAGEKPPAPNIEEETEEEYIKCGGDGELHTEPDLFMIKHMLDWVRDVDVDVDVIDTEKVVEISKPNTLHDGDTNNVLVNTKLNPLSTEFVPKNLGSGDNNDTATCANNIEAKTEGLQKPKKMRRERNAALESLLDKEQKSLTDQPKIEEKEKISVTENRKDNTIIAGKTLQLHKQNIKINCTDECPEVKLLRPNDFISHTTVREAVDKVTEWLQAPTAYKPVKVNPITVSPSCMFKKKQPKAPMLEKKSDASSVKSSDSDTPRIQPNNTFVPSMQANEYYKKYVERSQMQKIIQEDIWEKAERVMKEIDAKRLKDTEDEVAKFLVESTTALEVEVNSAPVEDDQTLSAGHTDSELIDVASAVDVDTQDQRSENQDNNEVQNPRLKGLDLVRLPKHRHDLPEECKVCVVLAKYKPFE